MKKLLTEIRGCTTCAADLPDGPRPIVQGSETSPIVIIGQAPGRRVHASGVPWDDPSGVRLREWLGLDTEQFYDPTVVAIMPMGFCYPGSAKTGDLPPRPECAPQWHERMLAELPTNRLEVIIGMYAQERYIDTPGPNLTETVRQWASYLPSQIVMPHPSPRNRHWLTKNPWFESKAVPALQGRVKDILSASRRPYLT